MQLRLPSASAWYTRLSALCARPFVVIAQGTSDSKLADAEAGDIAPDAIAGMQAVRALDETSGSGVHDPSRPILFREFQELLVRIAKLKYFGNEPSPLASSITAAVQAAQVQVQAGDVIARQQSAGARPPVATPLLPAAESPVPGSVIGSLNGSVASVSATLPPGATPVAAKFSSPGKVRTRLV